MAADPEAPTGLPGIQLTFIDIAERKEIGLNSIILVPRQERGGGSVVLAINRSDLNEDFLRRFFASDATLLKDHPFANRGVEALLRREQLVLKLHAGVALHLRNGTPSNPSFRTFSKTSAKVRVIDYSGKVFVSAKVDEVRAKASDIFFVLFGPITNEQTVISLPDGGNLIVGSPVSEDDFPRRFTPAVE